MVEDDAMRGVTWNVDREFVALSCLFIIGVIRM